jgi:hypothetical protein
LTKKSDVFNFSPNPSVAQQIRIILSKQIRQSDNGISSRGKAIGPILSQLLVRARLRSFQRRIYEQLSEALQLLLPTFRREASSL